MENLPQKKQEMLAGDRTVDGKLGPGPHHPTAPCPAPRPRVPPPYLKGLVSSRSTNPKEAYMRTKCSKRRASCWEISSNCVEGGAS